MKDLDKTQVYDLIGITEEQAKELYRRICERDKGWIDEDYRWLKEDGSLEFIHPCWVLSGREPTTHILTLFEPTYEEQMQEAKNQLDHYKKEVERLENESKPKIGDVCKFWDFNEGVFIIGELTQILEGPSPYLSWGDGYRNAKKVTEQEVIDLLFKKS